MVKELKIELKLSFIVLLFFFALFCVSAITTSAEAEFEITYLRIDVEIMEDLSLRESVDIIIYPKEEMDFNLYLPKNYRNLEIIYNDEKLDPSITQIIKLASNELNSIKISYFIAGAVEGKKNDFIYMRELLYSNVKNLIFRIKLPPAYGINSEDISAIIPEPTYLQSDGKRIIVLWEMKSPKTPMMFKIKYNSLVTNNGVDMNILVSFAIILILFISLGIFLLYRFTNKKELEVKIPPSLLSEDEMTICDIIKNEGGIIKQKKLSSLTGFSKAKITKILTNLEKKELIEREPVGRTFVITLKKKIDH
ncbi:MAG: MarR family protein [Candidatus Methanofastidiosum methylothiophilum]|uniref:MarR family protein n=1 Tax=Candidatus Methanofastidiosum methylothiophilum TaxID=1705564 RepID=A0A150IZV2_9EURY|nr:MAG: MarR family protein [Candidatus Methanofastidiosum methylthiophilus]KYC47739.1 MAG: MarR family protein [Candidatus Methanofastidiosum methylthiophilus]KYC50510.1 MAG: MarR family protein [Candidatus Methanofastidiosum methylthiophilus]